MNEQLTAYYKAQSRIDEARQAQADALRALEPELKRLTKNKGVDQHNLTFTEIEFLPDQKVRVQMARLSYGVGTRPAGEMVFRESEFTATDL